MTENELPQVSMAVVNKGIQSVSQWTILVMFKGGDKLGQSGKGIHHRDNSLGNIKY